MAHCSVGYWHPYLHRQCLRLERTDKAYYAGYGFYPERNDLDFFDSQFYFSDCQRDFWAITLKNTARVKAVSPRPASLVWVCSVQRWHCISTVCRSYIFFTALSAVSVLGPVISPCFDAGQMVSQQPRLCHRSCYHGFRFCQPDRRSADADPGCQIRTGTELYHSRLRVHGYHGRLRLIS